MSESKVILGMDIGFGQVKADLTTGDKRDAWAMPVGVIPDKSDDGYAKPSIEGSMFVVANNKPFVVGLSPIKSAMSKERCLNDNYPFTDEYKALFFATLIRADEAVIDHLVTGLPVDLFGSDSNQKAGISIKEYREKVTALLQGVHQVTPKRSIEVKKVTIVPQPFGGYMSVKEDGKHDLPDDVLTMVVDPGFFSFDWTPFLNGDFESDYAGNDCDLAISRVLEKAAGEMSRDVGFTVTREHLEDAVMQGKKELKITKDGYSYQEYIDSVINSSATQNALKNIFENQSRTHKNTVGKVIMVGGGAKYYAESMGKVFPQAEIITVKDHVMSNAHGFNSLGRLAEG